MTDKNQKPASHATSTPSRRDLHRMRYTQGNFMDVLVLLAIPLACLILFAWDEYDAGILVLLGVVIFGVGAILCFWRQKSHHLHVGENHSESHAGVDKHLSSAKQAVSFTARAAWRDIAILIVFSVGTVAVLGRLLWMHLVLGPVQLAVLAIGLPVAIVLVSFYMVRYGKMSVSSIGQLGAQMFLLAFWAMAVFIFAACSAIWIERYVVK